MDDTPINAASASAAALRVFAYLTAERSALYRTVMRVFLEERERFALHLRLREVAELVARHRPDLAADKSSLEAALTQLCDWGNLERHQDTSEVRTVEEFYQPRYLYQLTREGEEAERAIARYLRAIIESGELQATALADIRDGLGELARLVQATAMDGGKVYNVLTTLRGRFEELTARAQTFMSSLQRSIELRGEDAEGGLLRYKEVLIDYLQKFILELRISSTGISARILEIERGASLEAVFQSAAARELADSLDPADEARRFELAREWELRWRGLRAWFLGEALEQPHSEILRRKALSAVPQLLGAIQRLNERRITRTDRVADLRTLARWFAETDTETEAHQLWTAAFGLHPSRHLTIDPQSVVSRETDPVRAQTSWRSAPPIRITPRLRATSRYTRRGQGNPVIDRGREKAYLASLALAETEQMAAAREELISRGAVRLGELGPLSGPGFELFLDLLGDALSRGTSNSRENEPLDVVSSDGTLVVRLDPIADAGIVTIATASGTFSGPDHWIRIRDIDDEVSAEPADRRAAIVDAPPCEEIQA